MVNVPSHNLDVIMMQQEVFANSYIKTVVTERIASSGSIMTKVNNKRALN